MQKKEEATRPGKVSGLHREAEEIRRLAMEGLTPGADGLAPWQQILAVPLLILVLGAYTILLLADDLRQRVLDRVAGPWFVALEQPPEIYRLPPPPPKPARAELSFSTRPPVHDSEPTVPVGASILEPVRAPRPDPGDVQPAQKNAKWDEAFRVLQAESEVVEKLLSGEVSGLRFEGWEPLRADPPRYSIRLNVHSESKQRSVVFAWSVDVSDGQTRPENQAARDLFFKLRKK